MAELVEKKTDREGKQGGALPIFPQQTYSQTFAKTFAKLLALFRFKDILQAINLVIAN